MPRTKETKIVDLPCEVFVIHLDGKPLHMVDVKTYRNGGREWKQSQAKRVYLKRGHAVNGVKQLPEWLQEKVEVVRYVPEKQEVVHAERCVHGYTKSCSYCQQKEKPTD